jgi:4-amino-4-deoxy-L-arabinose transferase-like glycosyltransferase
MSLAARIPRMLQVAERLVGSWLAVPANSLTLLLLLLFVATWTLFQIIAHASVGVHFDQSELYDWARHPGLGTYKHPPLAGWIGTAWYSIFPPADWSSYLLGMVNAAGALFAVSLIARQYLPEDKRLLALLLLLLTPFFQFHSYKFSTNQTLLLIWPLATYCFLRAFGTRDPAWSVAAGATAALAMLGKYYSIFLVGSFVIAALTHPARWNYLRSASPWISLVAGVVVLAPHVYWLVTSGFPPFAYAYDVHGSTLANIFLAAAAYPLGAAAYVAIPVGVYLLVVRPSRQVLAQTIWPSDPDRRMLVILLAGQLLLPPLASPFLGLKVSSLWTMSAWFLLPVILLQPSAVTITPASTSRIALLVGASAVAALLAAPFVALTYHLKGARHDRNYFAPLTTELTRIWQSTVGTPLRIVTGNGDLSLGVAFYHRDRPDPVPYYNVRAAPWVTPERSQREGWAALCRSDDTNCLSAAQNWAAGGPAPQMHQVEIIPRLWGVPGRVQRFTVIVVPPLS